MEKKTKTRKQSADDEIRNYALLHIEEYWAQKEGPVIIPNLPISAIYDQGVATDAIKPYKTKVTITERYVTTYFTYTAEKLKKIIDTFPKGSKITIIDDNLEYDYTRMETHEECTQRVLEELYQLILKEVVNSRKAKKIKEAIEGLKKELAENPGMLKYLDAMETHDDEES